MSPLHAGATPEQLLISRSLPAPRDAVQPGESNVSPDETSGKGTAATGDGATQPSSDPGPNRNDSPSGDIATGEGAAKDRLQIQPRVIGDRRQEQAETIPAVAGTRELAQHKDPTDGRG